MKQLLIISFIFLSLSSFGQFASDIYLFDMNVKDGRVTISNGVNITKHKGYDNQPFFHPSKPLIYYSSFTTGDRTDIKYYNYTTKITANLTNSHEREYSPTVTPDEKFISCIIQRDNKKQDLGKYPINGGAPIVLINKLKVGYHAWIDKDRLLLFVLVDSTKNNLHYYNLSTKKDSVIAENPGRSLNKIPGENAMSFIQKNAGRDWLIQKLDLGSTSISTIAHTLPGQENLTWLQNDIILMSDGDNKLFSFHVGVDKDWQPVIIVGKTSMMKGVTRLATNPTNTKLAVVVTE